MTRTILYLVDSLGLSGKTRALTELALGLDPARYKPVVATLAPPDGVLVDRLRAAAIPVAHVPCSDGVAPSVVARLVRLVGETRPAIVHCYNPRPMLYGGLAAAAMARPAVGSLSAFACMEDRPYPFLPQALHTRTPKNKLRNRLITRLMRRLAMVSPLAARVFRTTNAVPPEKVSVISYGVDLDGIERVSPDAIAAFRAEVGVRPGELLVGSVGRLVEQKDYEMQLRAFARAHTPDAPLRMAIAGGGPLAGKLQALARSLGVADRVHWLGERANVWPILRGLDAFVIASKFEPYGVAVLEAMAAGLPIIATGVNELPEILDGGRAGRLVAAGVPDELATALRELARDARLRAELGGRARARAAERHALRGTIAAYQALYDEVTKETP